MFQGPAHKIRKAVAVVAVVVGASVTAASAGACIATARATLDRNPSALAAGQPGSAARGAHRLKPWRHGLDEFTLQPRATSVDRAGAVLTAAEPSAAGFDYTDAGVGAAAALVAVLLGGGSAVVVRRHRATQPAAL